jgi:sugar lactone lactonase YvrE
MTPEIVFDDRFELGEGPTWDAGRRELAWVDIDPGHLHVHHPESGRRERFEAGRPLGAAAQREAGGFVLAVAEGFALLDRASGAVEVIASLEHADPERMRMNDGAVDSGGRFWAGSVAPDDRPGVGALYRLDPDGRATTIFGGVTVSNGIGWSPDDRTMYYVDTATQRVDALDFDASTGAVENRRPLAEFPEEAGLPDGLTIDEEGFLWVAFWDGRCLRRIAPDGEVTAVLEFPASRVTSAAFGGPDLRDLYVTSARVERPHEPHAGALFRVRPGVAGRSDRRFRG